MTKSLPSLYTNESLSSKTRWMVYHSFIEDNWNVTTTTSFDSLFLVDLHLKMSKPINFLECPFNTLLQQSRLPIKTSSSINVFFIYFKFWTYLFIFNKDNIRCQHKKSYGQVWTTKESLINLSEPSLKGNKFVWTIYGTIDFRF